MENDLFILGDANINILDNGENILDKYTDLSKRKFHVGAIPKTYAQICSTLEKTVKKRLHKRVLSAPSYLTISLYFALGKTREQKQTTTNKSLFVDLKTIRWKTLNES